MSCNRPSHALDYRANIEVDVYAGMPQREIADGMHRLTVRVSQEDLTKEIRAFRTALQKETTREYLCRGQLLYDWLLRPLEPLFAPWHLDTLVVVPDGPLRTIPFAALHDGKQFLIAKYAVAMTRGPARRRICCRSSS